MIYHSRGVYASGDFKDNAVRAEDIINHIWYNLTFRPGRAFFVDGVCLNSGIGVAKSVLALHEGVKKEFKIPSETYC